ncbi:hypothetical protein P26059A_0084 [Curvibacter phage P26059A]|nr:hypothetical protein P26059A_0084 [Curvibacter phage P26059A]
MKMPDPIEFVTWGHSAEQMKQYGRDLLEAAAITAWNHYMDACKKAAINPSTKEQFLAASAIQKLKEKL